MSKHLGKTLLKHLFTASLTLTMAGTISTISQTKVKAEENSAVQYGQYKDYYTVIGPSQINKSEFPQLYTTTEKVYKHHGTSEKRVTVSDIHYSDLDGYKRSQRAYGIVTNDMIQMSKGTREPWEKNPFPSGWYSFYTRDSNKRISEKEYEAHKSHSKKISNNVEVTLKNRKGQDYKTHLFVKSHLFADSLGGRSFRNNVITGTQMQNVGQHKGGMQYIEKKVLSYVKKNPSIHVYYSVTPEYTNTELIPRSVLVSALSSDGKIDESVRVSNSAEGFAINYQYSGLINNTNTDEVLDEDANQPIEQPQEDEDIDDAA